MKTNNFNLFYRQKNSLWIKPASLARQVLAVMIAALMVSSSLMKRVEAAAGDLDMSFGSGGIVISDLGFNSRVIDMAVQADGKIVVLGKKLGTENYNTVIFLARYHPYGSLDTSFGTGGNVITDFGHYDNLYQEYCALALQPDGKILVVARSASFVLARYKVDGQLDTAFGQSGKAIWNPENYYPFPRDIELQADGKIVVVGSLWQGAEGDFFVARFTATGSLDISFGGGDGYVQRDFGFRDHFVGVAIQSDGKIVAGGYIASDYWDIGIICLARYQPNGDPDSTFGFGGLVLTTTFGNRKATDLLLQPDGKIVLATAFGMGLLRYTSSGTLDTSFGNGGMASVDFDYYYGFIPYSVALQPDGKIVIAGSLTSSNSGPCESEQDFSALARVNPDGSTDQDFGLQGGVASDLIENCLPEQQEQAVAVTILTDGRVLTANDLSEGSVLDISAQHKVGLVRYLGDAVDTSDDLSAAMSSTLSQDHLGNRYITYTIKVGDGGPDKASYVTLRDRLPIETAFYSLTVPSGWVVYSKPAVGQTGTISISKALFGPQSATITLVVKVHPSVTHATIRNSATISSSFTPDPNTANNTASAQTNIP
jgi:uncharacterized delta-60 repeat protein/uncharacterized repeat protein (TIGR01451 family)